MSALGVRELLRAPARVAHECRQPRVDVSRLALLCLLAIAMGGACFGATLGSHRGGWQALYAAIKVPLASLATLAICVPGFYGLAAALGRQWSARTVVAITLASAGRSSLVLLAFVPPLWFAVDVLDYHGLALLASVAYTLSGAAGLGILLRSLGNESAEAEPQSRPIWVSALAPQFWRGQGKAGLTLLFSGLLCIVGGQCAWMLRPYMGRPSQAVVPFLRAADEDFAHRLFTIGRSSMGDFDAPPPSRHAP